MELSNFGLSDLQALLHQVRTEIKRREESERENAWHVIREIARNAGVPLKELLNAGAASRVKLAPKYRHPENAALLWTGRGRQPLWLVRLLAEGYSLDKLRIQPLL